MFISCVRFYSTPSSVSVPVRPASHRAAANNLAAADPNRGICTATAPGHR